MAALISMLVNVVAPKLIVYAAPSAMPALQTTYDVTVTDAFAIIDNNFDPGEIVSAEYDVQGNGTPLVRFRAETVQTCRTEIDEDNTTIFCPHGKAKITIVNDTGAQRRLYFCGLVYKDVGAYVPGGTLGRIEGTALPGTYTEIPALRCDSYLVNAGDPYFVQGDMTKDTFTTGIEGVPYTIHYDIVLAWEPVSTCRDEYLETSTDTFEIDPTIEDPLGPEGEPADDQIFPVVEGETYRVSTDGGPWNDGTTDHTDAVFSWDGETWYPFTNADTKCVESNGNSGVTIYIVAASSTFYIRANDTPGNFADNTAAIAFTYTIASVYLPCDSQFTYDEFSDLVATATVPSILETGVPISDPLIPEEWYAIVVTDGTWLDDGDPPDRIDMEKKMIGDSSYPQDTDYSDLSAGSEGVWCQSSSAVYMQAKNTSLFLRVNDIADGFLANEGTLEVSIYHTTFNRAPDECELPFELNGEFTYGEVGADMKNGAVWGEDPSGVYATNPGGATKLEPGGWYVLDTLDSWANYDNPSAGRFYDAEISANDDDGPWIPLEEWDLPTCNVAIDTLGHRRIVFQAPIDGAFVWRFRAADTDGNWNNTGQIGWNLYQAINTPVAGDTDPWAQCGDDATWERKKDTFSYIPVQEENGVLVFYPLEVGSAALSVGDTYKIVIEGGPWIDDDVDRYDAALSSDDGATWYEMSDDANPNVDCVSIDQQARYVTVTFTVVSGQSWRIRVNDDEGDFIGNGGSLKYVIWKMRPEDTTGTGDLNGSDPTGSGAYFAVCAQSFFAPIWIPPLPVDLALFLIDNPEPDVPEGITEILDWIPWVQWQIQYYIEFARYVFSTSMFLSFTTFATNTVNYWINLIYRFFSICPSDLTAIGLFINSMRGREPFATYFELQDLLKTVQNEIGGYEWGGYDDSSLFSLRSRSDVQNFINDYILKRDATTTDPWQGESLVTFGDTGLPDSYYSCSSILTDGLPSRLRSAVCFVTAYFKETGAAFFVQLLVIDIPAIGLILVGVKNTIEQLIMLIVGVDIFKRHQKIDIDIQNLKNGRR